MQADVEVADQPVGGSTFAKVFLDHAAAVEASVVRICGAALAADATQQAFEDLWRWPGRYDPARGPVRPYLFALARRRAIDLLRSQTSRSAREHRYGEREAVVQASWGPSVDGAVLADERRAEITRALGALPLRERDAIVLAFFGGLSYREVAVALAEPEGTVKSRIRAGLGRLRGLLADDV